MPIAKVQLPDGRVARLEVPDGTSGTQVEAFVHEQLYGKPVATPDRSKWIPDSAPPRDESAAPLPAQKDTGINNAIGGMEAALTFGTGAIAAPIGAAAGLVRGFTGGKYGTPEGALEAQQRAAEVADSLTYRPRSIRGQEQVENVGRVIDATKIAGLGPTEAMALSAAPKPRLPGLPLPQAGDQPRGAAGASAAQRIAQDVQVALETRGIDFARLTQQTRDGLLAEAAYAMKAGGKLDVDALARKATIEAVGAKPTRAAVTRSPQDWQFEQNTRGIRDGIGDPIVKRAQENAAALQDFLGQVRAGTGGRTGTALEAGESAIGALKAQDAAMLAAVGKLYDAFRASGAQDVSVPAAKVADAMGKVADEIGHENIPPAVMSRLKEFGFAGGRATKDLTVNEADKLSRLINNNNPGNGPASLALGRIKSAVNQALLDVPAEGKAGVEALKTARAAAAQRFAEQDAGKGITAALDGVAPDRFVQKFILGADARDVSAMKAELLKSPNGAQALKDVKGHIVSDLLLKATGATSLDDAAGKAFSGVRFGKALDAIEPEKLHILFSPDEIGQLRTLQRASKYLTEEVPFSDVNHSKTTSALANLLLSVGKNVSSATAHIPIVGKIALGAYSLGDKALKDAQMSKAVAEAMTAGVPIEKTASASALSRMRMLELRAPSLLEQAAPGAAGAYANEPRERK